MKAYTFNAPDRCLRPVELPMPEPGADEILIQVSACGVCRTDLHIIDGELPHPKKALVPGHQIVGIVAGAGKNVRDITIGERIGVPWLGWTCGQCQFCLSGRENLCDNAKFTGYHVDGGFAEYALAHHRFCFKIPDEFSDEHAAPLLCAGLIGYRALRLAGNARVLGFYGFGAAAHILIQIARFQEKKVLVFTKPGDEQAQKFACELGATWAGDSSQPSPEPLEAAIIFAPVGGLVPAALGSTMKSGAVICAGIHMSDIPSFPYHLLWEERSVRSVANLIRRDGEEFFALIRQVPLKTITQTYPLDKVNEALDDLRGGKVSGAAVIKI